MKQVSKIDQRNHICITITNCINKNSLKGSCLISGQGLLEVYDNHSSICRLYLINSSQQRQILLFGIKKNLKLRERHMSQNNLLAPGLPIPILLPWERTTMGQWFLIQGDTPVLVKNQYLSFYWTYIAQTGLNRLQKIVATHRKYGWENFN